MILKKLTANGFKSFADRTEFTFGAGITCIVGPNGCGKSNVVDAIKWVLGEQSAKSLRGKQMMDVIFNGSGTRKSSGMSQVDLTFDNSDGALPIDAAEVVVTRRLYRSGESEYLLNKQGSRLKDIRELFLDTGVGVGAYSLIEQGRVDVLLQANPADRRHIFEEAAGISKYKVRKKEAQRRLERVDQNLLRVQDVVEEVEKRLRSVKLAAGKARNYQDYTQRLRELRSRYALSEYHVLRTTQDALDTETAKLSDEATGFRTEISNNEAKTSEANVRIGDLEGEVSQTESRMLTVQSQISAREERKAAAERRVGDQTDLLHRSRERLAGFDDQVGSLDSRLGEQQEAASVIEADLEKVQDELAELQEKDRTCAHELNESRTRLEDEKAGILDLVRRTSHLHNEIQGLNLQHESLTEQKSKLDERDAAIATELAEGVARQGQFRDRVRDIDQLINDQKSKLEETRARAGDASERRSALIDQHAAAKEYRSGLESRRELLDEMDRKHEGLLAGAREILERRDEATKLAAGCEDQPVLGVSELEESPEQSAFSGQLSVVGGEQSGDDGEQAAPVDSPPEGPQPFDYVLGAVGEIFDADVAHASMVEAALGDYQRFLVVASRSRLFEDREILAELSGRIQAFCLDCVSPTMGGPDLSGHEGYIACLLDWVHYPHQCLKLAKYLLGRTFVVESLAHAERLSVIDPVARFVTMEGIVWEADGRVGLGSLGSDTGLISRRSELRELARELEEVEQRIVDLADAVKQSESEVDHLEDLQQTLRTAIYEANTERVEAQSQLSSVEEVVHQLSEERPLIASEVSILVSRLTETREKETAGRQNLTDLEQRNTESERAIEELQAAIDDLTARRSEIGERLTSARVRVGELTQRRSSVSEAIRELQAARIQLQTDRDKASNDVVEAQRRIDQSREQIEEAHRTLEELSAENRELTTQSATLRGERDDLRAAVDQYAADARRLRSVLEETESCLHEREMKLQEIRVRREDLTTRIADELSVDLEAQYEDYEPDEEADWPAVEEEIEALRGKIERLGNVNLDAITEQADLEERLKFLVGQMEDLRSSEKQLRDLIVKLNHESEQRFLETFEAVRGHFSALFKKLFGGGKAEVSLTDPNDILECGIEIMARPPGKEPQSISLLSGGEKTMTAIALLLAVMRSRPAPFVLLDEVDAALDEANNIRFNHVIREFVKESQFIVITHSKRTMAIADVMYGVTMQEAGVSKRVSVRFGEEQEQQPAVA